MGWERRPTGTDGKELWRYALPAPAVPHGVIVDRRGQVIAALENGSLLCLEGKR